MAPISPLTPQQPHQSQQTTTPRARRSRGKAAVALVSALALASVLGACSTGGKDTASDSPGDNGGGSGFPVKVATKFGDIKGDKKPQRVVALGWGDAETALALGVQPVGASDWLAFGGDGVGPWAKGLYSKGPQKIGTLEPEFEKIAALKPDLILDTKSSGDQKRYDTLSKIAPTIGVPKGGDQYLTNWETQTTMVADALGLHDKGEQLITEVEEKFKTASAAHPEFKGKTATTGSLTSVGYGAYVKGSGRVDFLQRLGFTNNPKVDAKAGKSFFIEVSREDLDLLDADLLVVGPIGVPASKVKDDALYKEIPAVKAGHDLVFDPKSDLSTAFATDSVLSVSYALDKVVPEIAKVLK
ncbi:iron-siderophore ABC transporter substrate-binding protein [Streptomyces sp. NPDC001941]|uniref:iron-siderophore ABC transporter substrate-binding protein n=1 Tax=Streptomyces sp. NPDC001941 TaxID=3154659 RepID=UPI00332ACC03